MVELLWTEEALRWLRDIFDYISKEDPEAAKKTIHGIYDHVQILRMFPRVGYLYNEEKSNEIRILLYGHYRIAYLVRAPDKIDILGVFHGSLDIDKYLI